MWALPAIKIRLAQEQGQNEKVVCMKIFCHAPFFPSSATASKLFVTYYFHFARQALHGGGSSRRMPDNSEWEAAVCVPPASISVFIWCECIVEVKVLRFPRHSPILLAKQCGLHMTNQICQTPSVFPPHVQQKIWLQLLLHPKGNFQNSSPPHLSEMKLSRFLRSAEICLLI